MLFKTAIYSYSKGRTSRSKGHKLILIFNDIRHFVCISLQNLNGQTEAWGLWAWQSNSVRIVHKRQPQSRQSAYLFLHSSEFGTPPTSHPHASVPPTLWYRGWGTLAGESGGGRVPIPTRGHTLWYSIYLYFVVSPVVCMFTLHSHDSCHEIQQVDHLT